MPGNPRIKIAHVTYSLPIGGVTNVIKQLLSKKEEGVEQILILLSETEPIPAELASIKVYKLNYNLPEEYSLNGFLNIWLRPTKFYGEVVNKLKEIHESEQFAIYHFHGIPKDLPIGTLLQKQCNRLELVYTDHLMRITNNEYSGLKTKALAFIYKQFYKLYHVIFVSQAIFNSAKELGFVNPNRKNKAIENSIDSSGITVKTDYKLAEKIEIVYVSRISAVKGHFLLLPVAELLINKYGLKNFKFILIGPGELTESLQTAIQANKLENYFELRGPMQNVPGLLYAFDMAIFPSEREGLPVALLEKMAAGLPVVASSIPEIKNVIQQENEALLFPVNNAEACAAQLNNLISDLKLRETIGTTAKKSVEERYNTSLMEKYLEFYKELLQKK